LSETTGGGAYVGVGPPSARRKLRLVAYWSLAFPVAWMFGVGIVSRLFAVGPETMLWTALFPVWLTFGAVAAYQLQVLVTLHRPSMSGAIALGGAWAVASIASVLVSGLEAGITSAFVFALILSIVHIQATSIVEYLRIRTMPAQVGLYALLLAAAVSPVGLVVGAVMMFAGALVFGATVVMVLGFAVTMVSAVPLVAAAIFSHKARRCAKTMLALPRAEDPAAE